MLARIIQFIARLTASRYTRTLELELARLRAENRALLNSILGIAGIPPLRLDAEIAASSRQPFQWDRRSRLSAERGPTNPGAMGAASRAPMGAAGRAPAKHVNRGVIPSTLTQEGKAALSPDNSASASAPQAHAPRTNRLIVPANPLRRRSWQQIGRMLEISDARRVANRDNSDAMP